MSFTGRFVPEELGGRDLGGFAAFMLRLVLAGVLTTSVVCIASAAMLFNTAPAWLSLIFEPLSLFMLPGLAVSVYVSGPHSLETRVVVEASVVFYFVCFFTWLEWRAFRQRQRQRRRG